MARSGRPRVLDETKQREVCALVSVGEGIRGAARYVGCSPATVHREAKRNEEFGERMRQAEARARLRPLHAMRQAADTHWRAAAWMLERQDPKRWGRKQRDTFGRKQLRALSSDLLEIVRQEIVDTRALARVEERFTATIGYATRLAWDQRRTGSQLKQALACHDAIGDRTRDFWDFLEEQRARQAAMDGVWEESRTRGPGRRGTGEPFRDFERPIDAGLGGAFDEQPPLKDAAEDEAEMLDEDDELAPEEAVARLTPMLAAIRQARRDVAERDAANDDSAGEQAQRNGGLLE